MGVKELASLKFLENMNFYRDRIKLLINGLTEAWQTRDYICIDVLTSLPGQ